MGIAGDELGISVVDALRDLGLLVDASEVDIGHRDRKDLHVDPDAIHGFEPQRHLGHGWLDAEESRATELDDGRPRRVAVERIVVAREVPNHLEISFRVIVIVKVDLRTGSRRFQ